MKINYQGETFMLLENIRVSLQHASKL